MLDAVLQQLTRPSNVGGVRNAGRVRRSPAAQNHCNPSTDREHQPGTDQVNGGWFTQGYQSGMSCDTEPLHSAGLFWKNDLMPSRASVERPVKVTPRDSKTCASIG